MKQRVRVTNDRTASMADRGRGRGDTRRRRTAKRRAVATMVRPDLYEQLRAESATPADEICACEDRVPILLCERLGPNPLVCARCNGDVPPERIGFPARLASDLHSWVWFHRAFYGLWLDSGEFEAWAAAQLSDPASPVNRRGRALVLRLARYRRCYLCWFEDTSSDMWKPPTKCPRCRRRLKTIFRGQRPQGGSLRVCEPCSVALMV